MKKVLNCILLNPNFRYAKGSIYEEVSNLDPPLGLAALSAYLISKGIPTRVYDLNVELKNSNELKTFFSKIESEFNIDTAFFGIPFFTTFAKNSYALAKEIKSIYPGSTIIAGGAHASFMPEELLSDLNIDIVVRGEGEITLFEIIKKIPLLEIKGISYRNSKNDKIIINHNPDRARIKNLDTLPIPSYDQLKLEFYQPVLGSYKSLPAANMVTSRGCPGKCTFCCRTLGNFVSYKSPELVLEEISYLVRERNIKQINFYDDTFTLKKSRVIAFCQLVINNNLKFDWTCFGRIDNIDIETLTYMKNAGCYQIMYGVENFDQRILNEISKEIEVSRVFEVVKLTKQSGINCRVSILVGNPSDTKEIFKTNLNALKKLNPDILVVNITTPLPGTAMYRWAKDNNRLLTEDWEMYDGKQAVMKIDGLTTKDIYEQYNKMYAGFYLRFNYIVSRLKSNENSLGFVVSVKGFFKLIRFLIKRHLYH